MNVLSLFSGIGGLDLGLERAGMTTVGQVEIDPYCRRVLDKHWPEVPKHDDVRTAVAWWLGGTRPAVHVVAGGFPCQPVSVAGRRRAQQDERWLWPAAWAVVRDLRPDYAILENVPGLLARGMGDVLADLAEIGYDAEWDCVPAAAVGAPHRRDRVFVVAYPAGHGPSDGDPGEPERQHHAMGRGEQPPSHGGNGHVADTGGERRDRWASVEGSRGQEAVRQQASRHASDRGGPPLVADTPIDGWRQGRTGRPAGDGPDRAELAPTGLAHTNGLGRDRRRSPLVGDTEHADDCGPRTRWATPTADPWWRAEPDVGRVAHGVPARVDRLRALGNAVVPQVAEHIGRMVMASAS